MNLEEDLKRLAKRRDSGDLSSEQYQAEENCLLDTCVDRIHNSYRFSGATGRTPVVIRGTITSVELSDSNEKATLLLDTQKVKLTRSGKVIAVSDGDRLIVGGTRSSNGLHAIVYVNESNGDNSVDDLRKIIPKVIAAGSLGLLAVLAILGTTAIAVMTAPPVLSAGGVSRIAIYATSIAAALVLAALSLFGLFFGAYLHTLLQMIDRERLKNTR